MLNDITPILKSVHAKRRLSAIANQLIKQGDATDKAMQNAQLHSKPTILALNKKVVKDRGRP